MHPLGWKDKLLGIAVVVMGFSGLVAQTLLLRELWIVFSGNELCIGIILANWLILEALGSFVAGGAIERSEDALGVFVGLTALFSLSLFLTVFLARILRSLLGASIGEGIGLVPVLYASFLVLLPVSTLHGALFALSCRLYSLIGGQEASPAGRVYVYETVGTIVGGVVCTYLFIPYLHTFQAVAYLVLANAVACLALLASRWQVGPSQRAVAMIWGALTLLAGYGAFAGLADELHQASIRAQWRGHRIVHYQNSLYGNICVLENEGQYLYFLDGLPTLITPVPDIPFVQEFVHLPLLAHPWPTRILILSGGVGGVINEALKHPSVEAIDYAELDPLLLELVGRFPTPLTEAELNDERVRVHDVDGRLWLRATPARYDLIFVGIMEPTSLQTNRFFTREFFSLAQRRLREGGILVLGAPGSLTYSNGALRELNACIFHTLKSVFPHVRVIPGDGRNLFLASDGREVLIDAEQVGHRLKERGITAGERLPWHLESKLHPGWQGWFSRFLEGSRVQINQDFKPLGLFYSVAHWNALFAPSLGRLFKHLERVNVGVISLPLVLFVLLFLLRRVRRAGFLPAAIPLAIATSGLAGMLLQLVVIVAFQAIYGYVFSWIGLLTASFMAGAACGALLSTAALARVRDGLKLLLGIERAIIGLSIGLPFVLHALSVWVDRGGLSPFVGVLLLAVSFSGGSLTGAQFPLANRLYPRRSVSGVAGLLYASDLLGGWLGGMVGAVVFLPVLGLVATCVVVGLFKLTSFVVLITQPQTLSGGR